MFDLDNRKKHLPFLMKYVRLSTLSASFLKKIEEEPLLKAHSDCKLEIMYFPKCILILIF